MCGVTGYIGNQDAKCIIQESLKHLEYRGYDSHGSALLTKCGIISVHKSVGPIKNNYASLLWGDETNCGIGHVRWATNGKISKINAHPHLGGERIVLVHNGIVQNVDFLKSKLKGYQIKSETDTEIFAHYLDLNIRNLKKAIKDVEGDFAILFLIHGQEKVFAASRNIPLYIANTENGNFLASSLNVFDETLEDYHYFRLDNDELLEVGKTKKNLPNRWIFKKNTKKTMKLESEKTNGYITLREIKKQTEVINNFQETALNLNKNKKLILFGCGSSYNAANMSKYFFREGGFTNVEVYIPNELKYINIDAQYLAISQSGETKDVLEVSSKLNKFYAITNNQHSTLERNASKTIYLNCDAEIGVAATKTVTATMLTLLNIAGGNVKQIKRNLKKYVPLLFDEYYPKIPKWVKNFDQAFLFGNGLTYYCNIEGALKLKEMACVHAESVYATEVKHGPLALINEKMLSIFVITDKTQQKYIMENVAQVKSRGGKVLIISNNDIDKDNVLKIPDCSDSFSNAFLTTIYLQLFAWELGKVRGTNIDKPINLAKCVTV